MKAAKRNIDSQNNNLGAFLPFSVLGLFGIMEGQLLRSYYLPVLMVIMNLISFVCGLAFSSNLLLSILSSPRERVQICCKARVLFHFSNFLHTTSVWIMQVHIKVFVAWKVLRMRSHVIVSHVRIWSHTHSDKFTAWGTVIMNQLLGCGFTFLFFFFLNMTTYVISDISFKYS